MQKCRWGGCALVCALVCAGCSSDSFAVPDVGNALAGCSFRAQLTVEPEPETCIRFSVPQGSEARVVLEDDSPATCEEIEAGLGPLVVRPGSRAILFEDFVADSQPIVVEEIFTLDARECDGP